MKSATTLTSTKFTNYSIELLIFSQLTNEKLKSFRLVRIISIKNTKWLMCWNV